MACLHKDLTALCFYLDFKCYLTLVTAELGWNPI